MTSTVQRRPAKWHLGPLLLAGAIAIGVFLWFERGIVLRGAAQWWVVSAQPIKADAIFVLGGGVETRPFAAASLYKAGLASHVLISDEDIDGPVETLGLIPRNAELNREVMLKLGVPPAAISFIGNKLSSTYDEALALAEWTKATGAKRIIIPTELFPSRRVQWIFTEELSGDGVSVVVIAYTPPKYNINNWWHNNKAIIDFQNEIFKYLYYRLRY